MGQEKKPKLRGTEKDHLWKLNTTFSTFRFGAQDTFTFRVRQDLEQPALTRQPKVIEQWYEYLSYSVKGPLRGSKIISIICSLIMESCLKMAPEWEAIRSVALTLRSESRATSEPWQLTPGELKGHFPTSLLPTASEVTKYLPGTQALLPGKRKGLE